MQSLFSQMLQPGSQGYMAQAPQSPQANLGVSPQAPDNLQMAMQFLPYLL